VFQRIHSAEDRIERLNGQDVARFGLFIADLALKLDERLAETAPPPGAEPAAATDDPADDAPDVEDEAAQPG
jgi:hypothetical protein